MKKISLLLLVFVAIIACKDDKDEVKEIEKEPLVMPTEGLLAYYALDSNAVDRSGNGNHGDSYKTKWALDRNGKVGGAMEFNGIDSKIIANNTSMDDSLGKGVTFSAWIYYTGEENRRIIGNYNGSGDPGIYGERIGFAFDVIDSNKIGILYAIDGNKYMGRKSYANVVTPNKWVHVLGTWNGSFEPSGFNLFVDNVQVDTAEFGSYSDMNSFKESLLPFHIGLGHCSTGECRAFKGAIDDVRIYQGVLDADDIKLLSLEGSDQ